MIKFRYLLFKKANPNTTDDGGWTPIMSASSAGHYAVAKKLLDNGADPLVATEAGRTPLHYVCIMRMETMAKEYYLNLDN